MRHTLFLPLAAIALIGLSACGQKAKNEAAEANEGVGGDGNVMGVAVSDVDAAENAAFGAAEDAYSNVNGAENDIADANEIME